MKKLLTLSLLLSLSQVQIVAQTNIKQIIELKAKEIEPKVIAWRRDFHEHPELGNQEFRTAKIVADHLRSLGIEVTENVAFTGVVGVLKGGKPGPVMLLRADMDGGALG